MLREQYHLRLQVGVLDRLRGSPRYLESRLSRRFGSPNIVYFFFVEHHESNVALPWMPIEISQCEVTLETKELTSRYHWWFLSRLVVLWRYNSTLSPPHSKAALRVIVLQTSEYWLEPRPQAIYGTSQ